MATDVIPDRAVTDWLGAFALAKAEKERATAPVTPPDLDEFMKAENAADFESRYARLKLRIADIEEFPAGHCSAELTAEIGKVTTAKGTVDGFTGALNAARTAERLKALNKLEAAVNAATPLVRKHDQEMRKYYAGLKRLTPQINLAAKLKSVATPTDAWKDEQAAYDLQKPKVIAAQNDHKYVKANEELGVLETKVKELIAKRQVSVNAEVGTATDATEGSSAKAKKLVTDLDAGLIAEMGGPQQLALLKALRTKVVSCGDCGRGMTVKEFTDNGKKCTANKGTPCDPTKLSYPKKCKKCGTAKGDAACTRQCPSTSKVPAGPFFKCGECNKGWMHGGTTCNRECGEAGTNPDDRVEPDVLQARAKVFANMKMDPTFVEKDKKTRKAVVQKLRSAIVVVCKACKNVMTEAAFKSNGDKCTANKGTPCDPTQIGRESELAYAEENWADWAKNDPDKVTAFLTRILKEQCKTMGHDGPPLYYCQDCGKRFEPAQLVTPGNKCPDCNSTNLLGPDTVKVVLAQGGVDPGLDPGDYADATPTVPALIRFNKTHAGFNDFKEVLDTILHENSHAWQNMLVEKLKKSPPFTQADADGILNDPNLKAQAEFFLENDATYITSGVSPEAYRHEPLEEQAWSFGGNASRDLLVPPAVRSFQSKRGQKNKVLFIESVKRAAKAVVRLRTRHGIYASEWEGENPQDKKVVVEGVTGLNGATTVRQVIDEYTLEINRDSSALPRVKADHTVVEAELKKRAKLVTCAACTKEMTVEEFDTNGKKCTANLATACDPTKIKRVAELPNDKRNILLREIAVAKNFDATESEGMVVLRDKTSEFAEVERGRVILDESVTAMT